MGMCLTKYKISEDLINTNDIENKLYLGKNLPINVINTFKDLNFNLDIYENFNDDFIYNEIFLKLFPNLNDKYVEIIFDENLTKFTILNKKHSKIFTEKYNYLINIFKTKDDDFIKIEEEKYKELYNKALENIDNTFGVSYFFKDFNIPLDKIFRLNNNLIHLGYMQNPFKYSKKTREERIEILSKAFGDIKESCLILTYLHNNLKEDLLTLIENKDEKNYFEKLFPLEKDEIIKIDW